MPPAARQYINKTILVSISVGFRKIFEDHLNNRAQTAGLGSSRAKGAAIDVWRRIYSRRTKFAHLAREVTKRPAKSLDPPVVLIPAAITEFGSCRPLGRRSGCCSEGRMP